MSMSPSFDANLLDLPAEVLIKIFSFCDIPSLGKLCQTCKLLKTLSGDDCVWRPRLQNVTIVKNIHEVFQWGLNLKLNPHEPMEIGEQKMYYKLSGNWSRAMYNEHTIVHFRKKQMPQLSYDGRFLRVSSDNVIRCYDNSFRVRNQLPHKHKYHYRYGIKDIKDKTLLAKARTDVRTFICKQDTVTGTSVAGLSDGSITLWDNESARIILHRENLHSGDIQCLDSDKNLVVTGSNDRLVKLSSTKDFSLLKSFNFNDRIWSLCLSLSGKQFAVGTSCINDAALSVWDVERMTQVHVSMFNENIVRQGAGVFDIKYESQSELISCGYDRILRLWDLRSGKCEKSWMEPFDNGLNCLQTDKNHSIVTGSSRNGLAILWDKRKSLPVQLFHSELKGQSTRSPVYSLALSAENLFIGLDHGISVVDFNTDELTCMHKGSLLGCHDLY